MSSSGVLWLIFVLFFAAVEGQAIANKEPGDTLSEHVWKWIGKRGFPKPTWYKLRRGALFVFLVWLLAHFFGDL